MRVRHRCLESGSVPDASPPVLQLVSPVTASVCAGGIWQSNAYPCTGRGVPGSSVDDDQSSAVFQYNCRLNHSCLANAHLAWNRQLGRQTLHALREIEPGEELTVSCSAAAPPTQRTSAPPHPFSDAGGATMCGGRL